LIKSETINFEVLERALKSVLDSLNPPPCNLRERDGAIQRFEYTFELSWKVAKRVLGEHGIEALTPKNVIRELANKGWIDNPELWMAFLRARNQTSHTYQDLTADEVFKTIQAFPTECTKLINKLKLETKN
jgi:nucleotidyltransferase substrate binding protein (TIGR01987 family)